METRLKYLVEDKFDTDILRELLGNDIEFRYYTNDETLEDIPAEFRNWGNFQENRKITKIGLDGIPDSGTKETVN
jgi:hypothetical protein